jgi:hypothetical protein
MCENEFEAVFCGVNRRADRVVFVVVVEKGAFDGPLVYEVDVLAVEVIRIKLYQHVLQAGLDWQPGFQVER